MKISQKLKKVNDSSNEEIDISMVSTLEDLLVGKKWCFRFFDFYLVGEVEAIIENIIVLKNSFYTIGYGRIINSFEEDQLIELKPLGYSFVNINSITDFFIWKFELPKN